MTSTPDQQAREWWICETNDPHVDNASRVQPEFIHAVHVIEFSEVERLGRELAIMTKLQQDFVEVNGALTAKLQGAERELTEARRLTDEWRKEAAEFREHRDNLKREYSLVNQQALQLTKDLEAAHFKFDILKGDRDKFLASDDCYYWTPEAQEERAKLQSQVKVMRKALEFYAAKNNWEYITVNGGDDDGEIAARIDFTDTEFFNGDIIQPCLDENTTSAICGKFARKALAKSEEMEK